MRIEKQNGIIKLEYLQLNHVHKQRHFILFYFGADLL